MCLALALAPVGGSKGCVGVLRWLVWSFYGFGKIGVLCRLARQKERDCSCFGGDSRSVQYLQDSRTCSSSREAIAHACLLHDACPVNYMSHVLHAYELVPEWDFLVCS